MQMNESFPKPRFQIGQKVRVKRDYSFILGDEIYIVVQITLSCISVLVFPTERPEAFDYMLLEESTLGKIHAQQNLLWSIRESFIVEVE